MLRRHFVTLLGPSVFAAACGPPPRNGPDNAVRLLDAELDTHFVPWLRDLVGFQTVAGQIGAHEAQKAWLLRQAAAAGLVGRDEGTFVEIELPSRPGAPVLGLVVHGDVVPVVPSAWSTPPFALTALGDVLQGRGVADDKGPLVAALLVLRAIASSGIARTHAVRLLVGSTEESSGEDLKQYLRRRSPPDLSLVLDSDFPVVIGEKAWNALEVSSDEEERWSEDGSVRVVSVTAGTAVSIVPDLARLTLEGRGAEALVRRLAGQPSAAGTTASATPDGPRWALEVRGRAAHAGVNLEGGRNALVALSRLAAGALPRGPAAALLGFAERAGADVYGSGLGLLDEDPLWGRYAVNVATLGPGKEHRLTLVTNLRRIPPRSGAELRAHLEAQVAAFAADHSIRLSTGGTFEGTLWAVSPAAPLVRRLLAVHRRMTGSARPPVVSGGGTYAKRLPRSVPFGLWPGETPYPGHDVDERMRLADLRAGAHLVLAATLDLATNAPLRDPLGPPVRLP